MLEDLTGWLREVIEAVFAALVDLWTEMLFQQLLLCAIVFIKLMNMIPAPAFLTDTTLAQSLGNAGPTVAWALHTFKISEGMALIGAGYVFRLTRKAVTLGQW